MAVSENFKTIARILGQETHLDTVGIINLADRIESALFTPDYSTHDARVQAALYSNEVMGFVRDDKKIHAIKELRTLTSCGLKEAKEAVEDRRVGVFAPPRAFGTVPWTPEAPRW
jgi:hypothetical protein